MAHICVFVLVYYQLYSCLFFVPIIRFQYLEVTCASKLAGWLVGLFWCCLNTVCLKCKQRRPDWIYMAAYGEHTCKTRKNKKFCGAQQDFFPSRVMPAEKHRVAERVDTCRQKWYSHNMKRQTIAASNCFFLLLQ